MDANKTFWVSYIMENPGPTSARFTSFGLFYTQWRCEQSFTYATSSPLSVDSIFISGFLQCGRTSLFIHLTRVFRFIWARSVSTRYAYIPHPKSIRTRPPLSAILSMLCHHARTGSWYLLWLVSSYTSATPLRLIICGFDGRHDIAERVNHVSGSRFKKYNTFDEALKIYTMKFNTKSLHPVPHVGGPFWLYAQTPGRLALPTPSKEELWLEVDNPPIV